MDFSKTGIEELNNLSCKIQIEFQNPIIPEIGLNFLVTEIDFTTSERFQPFEFAMTNFSFEIVERDHGLVAEIKDSRSKASCVWGISSALWMRPTSSPTKTLLKKYAQDMIDSLETTPPPDVFGDRRNDDPIILWNFDDFEDIANRPTKVTVAFPDSYVFSGPSEGPDDTAYSAVSIFIEHEAIAPHDHLVTSNGFHVLYRHATIDDLDAFPGLRQRVIDAIVAARPDLAENFNTENTIFNSSKP